MSSYIHESDGLCTRTDHVRATGAHKAPGESSEIRMRLLKTCSILYTRFTFFGVRAGVIRAILVYLSITWTGLGCSGALLYSSGVEIELSPYIHPPSRLLCLRAIDSKWKMLLNSVCWMCLRAPRCLWWNSTVSSGAETSEADSQELCLWSYPFHLMRYWNLFWYQQLLSISSTSHSASLLMTMGGGWSSIFHPVIGSSRAKVSFTTLNTGWSCFIQCGSFKQ